MESDCLIYETKSPSEDYFRYAQFGLFQVGDKKVAGFNTHLSWILQQDDIRLKQTQELLAFARRKSFRGWGGWMGRYSSFLTGD